MNLEQDTPDVWVTVVIPAYNAATTIGKALQSAVNQTYELVEVVIVDDASTDNTLDVVKNFAGNNNRVRVLRRSTNSGGVGAPRNLGIAQAAGRYVMFLDADDELPPRACELLLAGALETGSDITAGKAVRVNRATGESEGWAPEVYAMGRIVPSLVEFPLLLTDPIAAAKLYRVDFLRAGGVWFPEGVFYEDTYFSTVAGCLADGITVITDPVYRWMWEPDGGSITGRTGELRSIRDRVAVHRATDAFLLDRGHWQLKVRKDSKFLAHDLRLYMRALAEGDPEFQQGFAEIASNYLFSISDEAFELCDPVDRVRAYLVMYQEIEAALTTLDYMQRKSVLSSFLVEEDGRVYWSGDHLHLPDARRMLDVTELGLSAVKLAQEPLFAQLDAWSVDNGKLSFEGRLVNRFGRIEPGHDLKLTLAVRNRHSKKDVTVPIPGTAVDERFVEFGGTVDLPSVLGDGFSESTVWNVSVIVEWNRARSRSPLNVRDVELSGLTFLVDGEELEGYRTVSGNLALRAAMAGRKTFESEQNDPDAPWMWWRNRMHPPIATLDYPFEMAVVVPCYNVAKYLDDCLGSIAAQEGFAATQVILVDDGATDETPQILDNFAQYYANVTVVHQENGGLGNARNNGLDRVTAPYVTFLDSDDILGERALAYMLQAAWRDGSEVVVGDLVNFPDRPYGPWKEYFGKGDRRIDDFASVPDLIFSGSACNKLFSTGLLRRLGVRFGEGVHFEDAWVTLPSLLRANAISLVDQPVYYYRGRPDGSSIMDSLWSKPANYRDHLRLNHFLLNYTADERDAIRQMFHRYATRTYKGFLCNARSIMARAQLAEMFPDIVRHYAQISDEVILEYATNPAQQLDHYAAKSGNFELFCDPERALEDANLTLEIDDEGFYRTFAGGFQESRTARVKDPNVVVESVRTRGDTLVVEGCMAFPGVDVSGRMVNSLEFVYQTAHAKIAVPLQQVARRDVWNTRNQRDLYAGWYAEIPVAELRRTGFGVGDFRLRVHRVDGSRQRNVVMKARLPLHRLKGPGRIGDYRYMLTIGAQDALHLRLVDRKLFARVKHTLWRSARELRILRTRNPGWRMRFAYWLVYPLLNRREIWLIGERSDTSQDNSYHFFKWIRTHRKRRNVYYVIDGASPDYAKVAPFGNVIKLGSFKHRMYLLHATKLIGSYDSESYLVPEGYRKVLFLHRFGELLKYQRVFLQHGISYNDVTSGLDQRITSYDLIVTAGRQESEYIAQEAGYGNRAVLAGFPRFDALKREPTPRPRILLMPTWRQWIVTASYKKSTGPAKTAFTQSEYFRFYRELLSDRRLTAALEHFGVDLEFFPHYEIRPQLHNFRIDSSAIKVADPKNRNVQQAMKECSLMVTDYSSVFFDVAYMGIPLVYVPFDEEDFYGRHYKRGYFNLSADGFGPVCRTVDQAVDEIIAAMGRGFSVESPYLERVEQFFAHRGGGNCERVFEAIDALGRGSAADLGPKGPIRALPAGRVPREREVVRRLSAEAGRLAVSRVLEKETEGPWESAI
ncbi:glycosyltransferase [Streptomyces sp. NBC_00562]|uniref:bifunctional glycosyltransferase/CDP-glycerol:glycerophosphate glycerophosphotransferase n=1 Tax=unclassified Streptomyces TaxID=2593676 RepID=UPI002E8185D0|nr:glycosyltransferase [Streptomyces sp. NBC_00562]WUC22890.1 bifunctional glycosyltransferase family 2 protein/CDP-glycerol:glycerophosphate glycerophosphotransferase [Streptomyces sp. NBC_00562]